MPARGLVGLLDADDVEAALAQERFDFGACDAVDLHHGEQLRLGARAIGPFLDGSVIVAEYGGTPLDQLGETVELLRTGRVPLFGFVINKVDDRIPPLFGVDLAEWRSVPWLRRNRPPVTS